jgi:hypothetical protein
MRIEMLHFQVLEMVEVVKLKCHRSSLALMTGPLV